MAIIIGDIHGDPGRVRVFLDHEPAQEHIVLGDLVDARRGSTLEAEQEALDLLLASDAVLLWGNHDLAYLPERPWRCYGVYGEMAFSDRYQEARDRFFAAYAVDGWLCTHAGVGPEVAALIPAEVVAVGVGGVATWLNAEAARQLIIPQVPLIQGEQRYGKGPLFNVHPCRSGSDPYGGIFWYDADGEQSQPSRMVGPQIFGHTPVPYPERAAGWINLNTFEEGIWVYDTQKDQVVKLST